MDTESCIREHFGMPAEEMKQRDQYGTIIAHTLQWTRGLGGLPIDSKQDKPILSQSNRLNKDY